MKSATTKAAATGSEAIADALLATLKQLKDLPAQCPGQLRSEAEAALLEVPPSLVAKLRSDDASASLKQEDFESLDVAKQYELATNCRAVQAKILVAEHFKDCEAHWMHAATVGDPPRIDTSRWIPLSDYDSAQIDVSVAAGVSGRFPVERTLYDLDICARLLHPAYWEAQSLPVRRSTWFRGNSTSIFSALGLGPSQQKLDGVQPIDEMQAALIEAWFQLYKWDTPLKLPDGVHQVAYGLTTSFTYEKLDGSGKQPILRGYGCFRSPTPPPQPPPLPPLPKSPADLDSSAPFGIQTLAALTMWTSNAADTAVDAAASVLTGETTAKEAVAALRKASILPGRVEATLLDERERSDTIDSAVTAITLPPAGMLTAVPASLPSVMPEAPPPIRQLVFVLHGIGEAWGEDRSLVVCCNRLRDISVASQTASGMPVTTQWLPITWHTVLQDEKSVQEQMHDITLPSVPAIRNFMNKALTDILFFLTPIWRTKIMAHISASLTRRYHQFCARNPGFCEYGRVSVAAHSLGSVIAYELLRQQVLTPTPEFTNDATTPPGGGGESTVTTTVAPSDGSGERSLASSKVKPSRDKSITAAIAAAKEKRASQSGLDSLFSPTSKEAMEKPKHVPSRVKSSASRASLDARLMSAGRPVLDGDADVTLLPFTVDYLFTLGSPLGLFLTVRPPQDGEALELPHGTRLYNIFHPYDPVAYRLEPLLLRSLAHEEPGLVPLAKGGKRLHVQLSSTAKRNLPSIQRRVSQSAETMKEYAGAGADIAASGAATVGENVVKLALADGDDFATASDKLAKDLTDGLTALPDAMAATTSSIAGSVRKSVNFGFTSALGAASALISGVAVDQIAEEQEEGGNDGEKDKEKESEHAVTVEEAAHSPAKEGQVTMHELGLSSVPEVAPLPPVSLQQDSGMAMTGGERLDWALQQSNIATTQTYVAAMTSHSCYWESDDAVVFMLGKLEKPT